MATDKNKITAMELYSLRKGYCELSAEERIKDGSVLLKQIHALESKLKGRPVIKLKK